MATVWILIIWLLGRTGQSEYLGSRGEGWSVTQKGHEMEGSVCAEDKFCWSEVVFLPFQEEFK